MSSCRLCLQVIPFPLCSSSNEDADRIWTWVLRNAYYYSFFFFPFFLRSPLGLCFDCPLTVGLDKGEEGSSIFALLRWTWGSRISSTRFRISRSSFVSFCNAWSLISL